MGIDMLEVKREDIELPVDLLGKEINVCLLQLKSPFFDELSPVKIGNQKIFAWDVKESDGKSNNTYTRKDRVDNLLKTLSDKKIINQQIHILVFPEYAIDYECINIINEFSKTNKTIVIAGLYKHETRKSTAIVTIPSSNHVITYTQEKISIAVEESDYIDHSVLNNKNFRFIWNTIDSNGKKNQFFFQIFICLDFLSHSLELLDRNIPGLVIVPMNSSKCDDFYGLSSYIMRSPSGFRSLAVALCNGTDLLHQNAINACGLTQFVGPSSSTLGKVNQYIEGGIISSLNLGTAITKPTRTSEMSYVISSQSKFTIGIDGKILQKEKIDEKYLLVNPNVLINDLGLHKIYTLFVANNYYKFRTHLKNSCFPIKCNGIYGAYDILMQAYEENWDFFDQRLNYYLEDEYEQITKERQPEYYEITDVIKFRGKILSKITSTEYIPLDNFDGMHGYLIDHLSYIRDIMLDQEVPKNIVKDLLKKKILSEVESRSDLSRNEKQVGMEEYLLLLFLLPGVNTDERMVVSTFQSKVLQNLIEDSRVRTVEFCKDGGSNGARTCKGTYIFHIVGRLDDLKDIIINKIHKLLYENNIKCGTRVIPAAELITDDKYEALNETIIGQKYQKTILKVIKALSSYPQPFCIKKLPIDIIKDISFFVNNYGEYVEKGINKSTQCCSSVEMGRLDVKKEFELNLYKFVHYICTTIMATDKLTEIAYDNFRVYCGPIYNDMGPKIESFLVSITNEIYSIIDKSSNKEEYLEGFKKRGVVLNKSTTVAGDHLKIIGIWNSSIACSEHKCEDDSLISDLKKLNGFIKYRNFYAHAFEKKFVGDIMVNDFSRETLLHAISAINIINKYGKQ